MRDAVASVGRLARTDVTVTLTGETGTGKDVFAHLLHDESPRAGRPFVVFDCGAVSPSLVERELFGYTDHPGAFERAHRGTLFLDEVGDLPVELQHRLLRVLDNRLVRRVGESKDRQVDVRIVAATNHDLASLIVAKRFRQDLYFRLAAAIVHLPPLRERLEDLPGLVPRLLMDLGHGEIVVEGAALEALRARQWPGNVRQLKNALGCALAFVDDGVLRVRHLRLANPPADRAQLDRLPLGEHTLDSIERVAIKQTVVQAGGNKLHAARTLGIAPSTLYEKLRKYGL